MHTRKLQKALLANAEELSSYSDPAQVIRHIIEHNKRIYDPELQLDGRYAIHRLTLPQLKEALSLTSPETHESVVFALKQGIKRGEQKLWRKQHPEEARQQKEAKQTQKRIVETKKLQHYYTPTKDTGSLVQHDIERYRPLAEEATSESDFGKPLYSKISPKQFDKVRREASRMGYRKVGQWGTYPSYTLGHRYGEEPNFWKHPKTGHVLHFQKDPEGGNYTVNHFSDPGEKWTKLRPPMVGIKQSKPWTLSGWEKY